MKKFNIFDRVSDLKELFLSFFTHRKKLKALENYSVVSGFQHRGYLKLIGKCIDDGFLGSEEAAFLDHMLQKYEINFLDWSHRTKWIKRQIAEMSQQDEPAHVQFDLFAGDARAQRTTSSIPLHLLNGSTASGARCSR